MDCALLALCLVYTITLKVFLYSVNVIELKIGGETIMLEMMIGLIPKPPVSPVGQTEYAFPGSYSWTCPADVFTVCVAILGAGESGSSTSGNSAVGGRGGGVRWQNAIPVIPGNKYTIVVGSGGTTRTLTYNDAIPVTGGTSSTAFGIIAGVARIGTAIGGAIGGFGGSAQGRNLSVMGGVALGGDSASYIIEGPMKFDAIEPKGLLLRTGAMVTNGTGTGGRMVAPTQPYGSSPKTAYKGGDGTVRIIWGANRAFPSKNIGDK